MGGLSTSEFEFHHDVYRDGKLGSMGRRYCRSSMGSCMPLMIPWGNIFKLQASLWISFALADLAPSVRASRPDPLVLLALGGRPVTTLLPPIQPYPCISLSPPPPPT